MFDLLIATVGSLGLLIILATAIWFGMRLGKGKAKLDASRAEVKHNHLWSPWGDHEVALYDGPTLVRYAPGQLRTCLDPSCGTEDVRMIGGQATSGEKDLD